MLKPYERRIGISYFLLLVAMFLVAVRIVNLSLDPKLSSVANSTAMRTVTLSRQRGTVFDRNMEPITNREKKYVTLITDIPSASITLCDYFTSGEVEGILRSVREGGLPMITTDKRISGEGLVSYGYTEHQEDAALHLVGYTDDEGHGVSGLEAVFDELLYSDEIVELTFGIDGHGKVIKGDNIDYKINSAIEKSGVMLTIDYEIQRATEQAANSLTSGAVVVMDVKSGEIMAMVSRPDFSLKGLAEALGDSSSPLLNRAMQTYSVGSGFKPCVAAAALEAGRDGFLWFCGGYADIDGQIYRCHKLSGHKWLDMTGALKHSCNTYFYNLAINVGAEKIYQMAERAGFNNAVSLGYGISTKKAQIGDKAWLLKSDRALANLAIGQGELMISPIGILPLYCAIASDGSYVPPSLIKGFVENSEISDTEPENKRVELMSKATAEKLKKALLGVLDENGTGASARPKTTTAAGKTSTAETGIIKDGESVVNRWFCGFFPYDEPKYAVAVLSDDSKDVCGQVFAEVADKITAIKKD